MTDWTTPEDVPADTVERLHRWLLQEGNPEDAATPGEHAVADIIRTFWPVPPRTLSKELAHITEVWETWTTDTITGALTAATDRAKQVENDRDAARAEVKRERDLGDALAHERDDTRAELERVRDAVDPKGAGLPPGMTISEAVQTLVDGIPTGEHEGLTAEQWKHEYDRTRAEVERLTDVNETLRRTNNFKGFRERLADVQKQLADVQKGAESNAETPDPADAKPGEAWLVEVDGDRRNAVKDHDGVEPWCTFNADGWFLAEDSSDVTLVSRLVPAPRVITNADELDRLPHNSVILSADNDAWQKSSETSLWASAWWTTSDGEPSMWVSYRLCDEDHPVTVLWEPEA